MRDSSTTAISRSYSRPVRRFVWLLAAATLAACDSGTDPDPTAVASIVVTAPNDSVFRNDTLQFVATVQNYAGETLSDVVVEWSSSVSEVASIDESGKAVGVSGGKVEITATASDVTGRAELTVVGPGTQGASPGSAAIGSAGGQVAATLPGGGSMSLTLPPNALDSTVSITLTPLLPDQAEQAAFRISPAGYRLNGPATLVIRVSDGARVRPTTVLVFEQDGQQVPVESVADPAAGTVTATIGLLGLAPATNATAVFGQDVGAQLPGGNGSLLDLTVDQMIDDAVGALDQLTRLGNFSAADAMLLSMKAVVQAGGQSSPRFPPLAAGWRTQVCNAMDFAVNALNNFNFASDYRGFERVIGQVIGWGRAEADMKATLQEAGHQGCLGNPVDPDATIRTKLNAFLPTIQNDLNSFTLTPSPRDSVFLLDRIRPLLDVISDLTAAGFDAAANSVTGVVSGQFVRLRFIAYTECIAGQPQIVHSRLFREESRGGVLASSSPYELSDLEEDIELCGMPIRYRLLDSNGAVTAQGALGGGSSPGQAIPTATARLSGAGELEILGPLRALLCPAPASANAEQFEVLAGSPAQAGTRVGILTPSTANTYLAVSSMKVNFDAIRNAAGISPTGAGQARVVFRRIGETCSGLFPNLGHSSLGTLTLDVGPPLPPVSIGGNLPNGTVGQPYSGQLTGSGGDGTYSFGILGDLPPGITLGAAGQLTGTPTTAGTFSFTASVSSGGLTAEADMQIVVAPAGPAGEIYVGTRRFQGTSNPVPAALIISTNRSSGIFCISPAGVTPNDESRQCGALGPPFANDSGFIVYNLVFSGNTFTGQGRDNPGDTIMGTIDGSQLTGRQNFTSGLFNTFTLERR